MSDRVEREEEGKVSFFCIAKNEEDKIGKMLEGVKDFVDEIIVLDTGSTDKTVEIAESHGAIVKHFKWIKDFAAARNYAMGFCSHEVVFWLDCDDELKGGEKLRGYAQKLLENPSAGGLRLPYQYAFDDNGHCALEHPKMRLFKKDFFIWRGRIHEDALPKWECKWEDITDVWVKHDKSPDEIAVSTQRNMEILLEEYDKNPEDCDARTLFYLGNGYLGRHEDEKALEFYERHFELSGWNEEKYLCLMFQSDAYIRMKEFSKAIDKYLGAMKLIPQWPDAYFGVAQVYLSLANYDYVEEWTQFGVDKLRQHGIPKSQVLSNPRRYDLYPALVLEDAYIQQGKFEKAIPLIEKIIEFMPESEEYKTRLSYCHDVIEENHLVSCAKALQKRLQDDEDDERLKHLAMGVPKIIEDMPTMARLRGFEQHSDRKEVCIYCGPNHQPWTPLDVKTGIGGSEEAVINISKELTALGYLVTVYSWLPSRDFVGDYDGVTYKDYYEIYAELEKKWDTVILWRTPGLIRGQWNTDNLYLWLHDMQQQTFYTPEIIEKVDKVFVLSEFHRKNVSFIPDDKIFVTTNGIDVSHFDKDVPRDQYKVIYASSPDRGLDNLLYSWPKIKEAVPEATLDIYYGFTPIWDSMYFNNPKMMQYRKDIMKIIAENKDNGVVYHGRVGHQKLADAMLGSSVWAYPTSFPEISCITAMKMQAAGTIPVCTKYAALNETVVYGNKLDTPVDEPVAHLQEWRDKFTEEVIKVLLLEPSESGFLRATMQQHAAQNFGWDKVAAKWSELFREKDLTKVS